MRTIFFNGPVQNGTFTLASRPGKAVGIRLASALNTILGNPTTPHLWNTVTLAGDVRHREERIRRSPTSRLDAEAMLIAEKYLPGLPPAEIVTDTDVEVGRLALEIVDARLRSGSLIMDDTSVYKCHACGHMTGSSGHPCRACGNSDTRRRTERHLVSPDTVGSHVIDRQDIHASHRRLPRHLQGTARAQDRRLIMSRTREHGIDLSPLGLPGLVLDPRVGVHVAVLAVACRLQADVGVMTITENAANNVAAYGREFRCHGSTRVQYALHGRVPYDYLTRIHGSYTAYGIGAATRETFETWFLPLIALHEKNVVREGQLRPLFKLFMRACMNVPPDPDPEILSPIREAVANGRTDWVMNKIKIAHALSASGLG